MKKYVLTIALVLLLLVSCATKKTEQEQVPEVVETTVIEQLPPTVPAPADEIPPAEETVSPQETPTSEESFLPEVIAPLEDIPSETEAPASSDAPVTDWGYVFTSPAAEEAPKAQTPSVPAKAPEVKKDVAKPSAPAVQPQSAEETVEESITNNSFISKVINFISHETLFSIGLVVCLGGLIYFIIAMVRSSGMTSGRKKKAVRYVEKPEEPAVESHEDVEMKDNSSEGFNSEEENDAFLRALLGEDKK